MNDAREGHPAGRSAFQPHPVDIHVGNRIATARKLKRISQVRLGEAIGVTFQQIQKYEKGSNRVSASMLFEIAQALNLQISYFFEGLADDYIGEGDGRIPATISPDVEAFMSSTEGLRAIETLSTASPRVRRAVIGLIRSLTREPG